MMAVQVTLLFSTNRSDIVNPLAWQARCLKRPPVQSTNTRVAENAWIGNTFLPKIMPTISRSILLAYLLRLFTVVLHDNLAPVTLY